MTSRTDDARTDVEERLDRLEAVVDRQQALLEEQQTIIERLLPTADGDAGSRLSRRSLLKAAGALGLVGFGTGRAAADPMGQLGTADDPLRMVHTEKLAAGIVGGDEVSSLLGTGLDVEDSSLSAAGAAEDHADVEEAGDQVMEDVSTLNFNDNLSVEEGDDGTVEIDSVDSTGSDTHTNVSDGGSTVVSDTDDIDFGSNLSVSDEGDGTVSISGTSGGSWDDAGSNLLEPTGSFTGITNTDTVGSSSSTALTLNSDDGTRALELGVPSSDGTNTAGGNFVSGHANNTVNNNSVGVVIGGGGNDGTNNENSVGGDYAIVGGGNANTASDTGAVVSGGRNNTASGRYTSIGGGNLHDASGDRATIAGGNSNTASADRTTVGGGRQNEASGTEATVGGGDENTAEAEHATIAGGWSNTASGTEATICGGQGHTASGEDSAVLGGNTNRAQATRATVAGGYRNTADGSYSFAAGREADTDGNNGAVVFGDRTSTAVTASAADQVRFQQDSFFIGEGNLSTGTGTSLVYTPSGELLQDSSSARYKKNIQPLSVDTQNVLDLEPKSFEYEETGEPGVGLIAEEVDECLPDLVLYDEEERPDAVKYDRLGIFILPEVRKNRRKIKNLEEIIENGTDSPSKFDSPTFSLEFLRASLNNNKKPIENLEDEMEHLRDENSKLRDRVVAIENQLESMNPDG